MAIACSERGTGRPMIFFHNAGSNRALWSHQVDAFADRYRTITVDLPGYGDGEPLDGDATLDRYARFVEKVVAITAPDEAPILVGHCIGAAMVLAATLARPTLARALVLFNVATATGIRAGGYGTLLATMRRAPGLVPALARVTELAPAAVRRASLRSQYLRTADDPYLATLVELNGRRQHIDALAALAPAMASYGRLEAFTKPAGFPPTMLTWGTRNKVLPFATAAAVRAALRPEVWHELHAGHLTMREAAGAVNAHMRAFLGAYA